MTIWPKMHRFFFAALGIAAMLIFVGCGDDDDDGDKAPTHPGANEEITEANAAAVWTQTFSSIAQVQAQAGGGGTVQGQNSGKAEVKLDAGTSGVTYTIEFDDFSNDGEIWIDGKLTIKADTSGSFTYTGKLTFSGKYSGTVEIDLSGSAAGVRGTLKVGGQTITI